MYPPNFTTELVFAGLMHPLREGISGSKFGEKTDKRHSQSSEMNEKLKGVHLCSDAVVSSRHQ